jgi:hypothetical protein
MCAWALTFEILFFFRMCAWGVYGGVQVRGALNSKDTRALTYEIFFFENVCLRRRRWIPRFATAPKISKVSALVSLLYKVPISRTFEEKAKTSKVKCLSISTTLVSLLNIKSLYRGQLYIKSLYRVPIHVVDICSSKVKCSSIFTTHKVPTSRTFQKSCLLQQVLWCVAAGVVIQIRNKKNCLPASAGLVVPCSGRGNND